MPSSTRTNLFLLISAAVVVVAGVLATRTGDGLPAIIPAAAIFLDQAPAVLLWGLAALGLGSWAAPLLSRATWNLFDREILILAVGIATLLWLDSVLGMIGGLGNEWLALGILAVLAIGGAWRLRGWCVSTTEDSSGATHWTLGACALPLGVLFIAALSTPGWLWASEFGGYDALSYHLQLPREWLLHGSITHTPHNAYGYLPNGAEAAFMHLGALKSAGMWGAMESSQLLAAGWTVLGAIVSARIARRVAPPGAEAIAAACAAALVLATPWVIVTGSLAYDESVVLLLFAATLLLLFGAESIDWRVGVLLGALLGGACLAKLSSGPLLVAPIVVASLLLLRRGRWAGAVGAAIVVGVVVMAPWMIRNLMWTGNPLFPYLTTLLGEGPWTADQLAIWNTAHGPHGGTESQLGAFFNEFMRQGIGPSPNLAEPWTPQWSLIPWLGVAGAIALALRPGNGEQNRRAASLGIVIVLSIAAWLLLTHAKARFLVPLAVPLSVLAAAGASLMPLRLRPIIAVVAWAAAVVPLALYLGEAGGSPARGIARSDVFRGDLAKTLLDEADSQEAAEDVLSLAGPSLFINHLLGSDAQVLLVGDAAPFHFAPKITYSTVWTRGPLAEAIERGGSARDWAQTLDAAGYTHLLINPAMLERWRRSGWLSDALTEANLAALSSELTPIRRFRNGSALFSLPAGVEGKPLP